MLHDDQVKQQLARFRPLCDADGYPLVGNIATKGQTIGSQPSELCTLVREQQSQMMFGEARARRASEL